MKPQSVLSVLLLGTLFCILYFDNCQGSAVEIPAAVAQSQVAPAVKTAESKPGNGTVPLPPSTLSRARRQACHGREPPGHRCSNDCHCGRDRYCSSYGYCHARNRDRRLTYSEDGEYNEAEEY
ncbi:unnamed protein product [Orchesella dallaii]|uniref:Uncharacterized protein n=1 Tax=Orchesella dallaii TaxID=48710 RepID=A0ABP1S9R4_9HEXA